MDEILGLPLEEALLRCPNAHPQVLTTAAHGKNGERQVGTWRVIAVRGNQWVTARFLDGLPGENADLPTGRD